MLLLDMLILDKFISVRSIRFANYSKPILQIQARGLEILLLLLLLLCENC